MPRLLQKVYDCFDGMLKSTSYRFGVAETPVGAHCPDRKRYFEFGAEGMMNVPSPLWELRQALCGAVASMADKLDAALLPGHTGDLQRLMDLARGPVLRLSWYPGGHSGEMNQAHTDVDLFTILTRATSPGLEAAGNAGWNCCDVQASELLVFPGEILQHFGGVLPIEHRVVSNGEPRMSASLFVNADPSLPLPGGGCVADLFEKRLAAVRGTSSREGG